MAPPRVRRRLFAGSNALMSTHSAPRPTARPALRVCAIRPWRIRWIGMAAAMGAKHRKRWTTGVINTRGRTAPAVCWIKLTHVDPQCRYTVYTTRTPRMRDSPLHQRPFDARSIHSGCARPSYDDRSLRCWAARREPSSHRLPSQHDLPCSHHSVSHVAQSRSHSRTDGGA